MHVLDLGVPAKVTDALTDDLNETAGPFPD
jgi:hypothetical protein